MKASSFNSLIAGGGALIPDIRYAEIHPDGTVFVLNVGNGFQIDELQLPAEPEFMQVLSQIVSRRYSGRVVFAPVRLPSSRILIYRQPFQFASQFFSYINTTRADADNMFDFIACGIDPSRVVEGDEDELVAQFVEGVKVSKTIVIESAFRASLRSGSLDIYALEVDRARLVQDRPYFQHQFKRTLSRLGNPEQAHIFVAHRDSQKCLFCFSDKNIISRTNIDLLTPDSILLQSVVAVRSGSLQVDLRHLAEQVKSSWGYDVSIDGQSLRIETALPGSESPAAASHCMEYRKNIEAWMKACAVYEKVGCNFLVEPYYQMVLPGSLSSAMRYGGAGVCPQPSAENEKLTAKIRDGAICPKAMRLIEGLSMSYSCHHHRDALIVLQAALEDIFQDEITQQSRLVSDDHCSRIKSELAQAKMNKEDIETVLGAIRSLKLKTRNAVIRDGVSAATGRDPAEIRDVMRVVSTARGKAAHTLASDTMETIMATKQVREIIRQMIFAFL